MDIFSVFTLCGGLAFFLYGMTVMSKSLEKMAGGKLERMLKRMTSSPFKSLLLGAGITIAIQSSSAMTVMLVGLVNSGVMELRQTIGIIMGSNIGTTLTAWILSLTGIESENVFVNLLKPENFSPLIALAGILLIMGSKRQRRRDVGRIMMGFAILMYGMELMSGAVSPLAEMPQFAGLLTAFENPLLGVLVGAVFTGIIQSSAASVAILQALAMTGSITYGMAIPIIMGQNIGTCVTALISSIGVNRNAKRVAVVHISFNVIGTAVCLILFYGGDMILHFTFLNQAVGAVGIAFCHTAFNVFTTILLLPFSRQLEKLARRLVRTEDTRESFAFLDPLLLRTPGAAVSESVAMAGRMGQAARENICLATDQLSQYSRERETQILQNEDKLDIYEDRLSSYLVEISQHGLSMQDMRTVSCLLHAIGDFERIGDHAVNIQESAQELHDKELRFSDSAREELLTAPARPHGRPVTEIQMADLLREVRRRFDFCLLDAPAGLGRGFQLATCAADRCVVVTTADASSLRDAQHTVMELDRFPAGALHLVVNRVRKKLLRQLHATIDDAIDKAGLPLLGVVPEDDALPLCMNRGVPILLADGQSAATAYRNIAKRLQGERVPLLRIR